MRFRLDLGYDGTNFRGWGVQPNLRTVQGTLEEALALVCRSRVRTVVAGRTDAGVHARRQAVHLDLGEAQIAALVGQRRVDRDGVPRTPESALVSRLRGALSRLDAHDVVIHGAAAVSDDFDARFSAQWRAYSYRLADDLSFFDPLLAAATVRHRGALDSDAMARAAAGLLGLHDFLPFCKPRPDSTTIRTLQQISVGRDRDGVIVFRLRADAFCHHMVRAIVGGLIRVGTGAWSADYPAQLLERASSQGGSPEPLYIAPGEGLVMEEVGYPPEDEWAARARQTRARRDSAELGNG
ncbi:tRNA pseudouridine(38-40) synthase TruA [Brevibacterium sp. HMSC063G07]|uniref:tRNA pseudouridine(38-40) synthase TruA n=1 Tax=Brevibacterium sp. HMSC063G07 TaxID=1739261 RepID=UPI0008A10DC2|nr:tRNA pseudouridine(38-40) synthase TruA [Brevibacterium sp. HMSC063G07]OFL68909.1 tRNA pseudouridine synthase A [Brevibacterium sp. HMSC063G07]